MITILKSSLILLDYIEENKAFNKKLIFGFLFCDPVPEVAVNIFAEIFINYARYAPHQVLHWLFRLWSCSKIQKFNKFYWLILDFRPCIEWYSLLFSVSTKLLLHIIQNLYPNAFILSPISSSRMKKVSQYLASLMNTLTNTAPKFSQLHLKTSHKLSLRSLQKVNTKMVNLGRMNCHHGLRKMNWIIRKTK